MDTPVAEITQSGRGRSREYLKEIAKKAGRPKSSTRSVTTMEEGEAFESIKRKWTFISHKLADEVSKAARDPKKLDGKSLIGLCTAAGIAYDKRWSKQVSDNTEIGIPASLATKLSAKLANNQQSQSMVLSKPCSAEPEQPVSLAGQDLEGLIGL